MKRIDDGVIIGGAALGWLGAGAYGVWELVGHEGDSWQRPYLLFAISLLLAASLTTTAAWRFTRATGRPALRRVGLGVGIAAAAGSMVAWAVPLWATLLAITSIMFAIAAPRGRRRGLAVLAAAQLVGMAVMIGAIETEFGRQDSYGDYPAAFGLGELVIAAGSMLGLAILARVGSSTSLEPAVPVRREAPAPA